jgi:hypothetical protein
MPDATPLAVKPAPLAIGAEPHRKCNLSFEIVELDYMH